MNAEEFRALRAAAGFSVRRAAGWLGVAPSSIQRWEGGATNPSDVADRIRGLVALSETLATAQVLGRLAAVLAYVVRGYPPQGTEGISVDAGTRAGIGRLIQRARNEQPERYMVVEEEVEDLLASISGYPTLLDDEQTAEFWWGYYTRRRE